jgi:hypothetical protein
MMPALAANSREYVFRIRDGHTRRSVASTYRHFDLTKLAKGVAAIPVPSEKSSQEIDADRSHDLVRGFPANGL